MKRILITGAASGFGLAASQALRRRGARVVGLDLKPGDDVIRCDVRDPSEVAVAVQAAIEDLGALDVLINNAGIGAPADSGAPPDERSLAILETNLVGAWRVTAAAMPALLASRGRVVNIASALALVNVPFAAAYVASKRALAGYSDVLRLEYRDRIEVTTVYPGYVPTPIHDVSEAMGISLGEVVPHEAMGAVVKTILRAALGPPRRDLATSGMTALGLFFARHAPRISDRVVGWRYRALARKGAFDASPFASQLG